MKLKYQTFRKIYKARTRNSEILKETVKEAKKGSIKRMLKDIELYAEHGFVNEFGVSAGSPLDGPYYDVEIVYIQTREIDIVFEGGIGEVITRIWYVIP